MVYRFLGLEESNNMTKRILILNWWDPGNPSAGGAEVYLKEIFSRLVEKGYRVVLLCSRFKGSSRRDKISGIEIIRIGSWWSINIISYFWYIRHKEEFDILIDFTNKVPYLTPLYIKNRPFIAIAHHIFSDSLKIEYGIIGGLLLIIERQFYKTYKNSHFIAPSKSTRDELVEIGVNKDRIKIIYEGQPKTHITNKKSLQPLIIYVGRLKKYKRIDFLMNALIEVKKIIPGLNAVIIGDGPDRKRLKELCHQKGLEKEISFLGHISDQARNKWLQKAWVSVQPSIKEGWGLTVIEAASLGTPTIAANVPGLCESVVNDKTGWLFERDNLDQLREILIKVLSDDEYRNQISKNAFEYAKQFNWDKTAREFEREIKKRFKEM